MYDTNRKPVFARPSSVRDSDALRATASSLQKDEIHRVLFQESADAILIIEDGRFVDFNDATLRMLGYDSKEELLDSHPSELSPEHQPDGRLSREKADSILSTFQEGSIRFEWDHVRRNGEVFPVEVTMTAVPYEDRRFLHVVWRDLTQRKRAEAELRRLSLAVEHSSSAVHVTDRAGRIEYVNRKFSELTGYSREDVIGETAASAGLGELPDSAGDALSTTGPREWKGECLSRRKDGSTYRARLSVAAIADGAGEVSSYVTIQDDVTREHELAARLNHQASHDSLTGLINRREFERRIEALLDGIRREDRKHAMCYLDLDQFKVINDTWGHTAGDRLLQQLSPLLGAAVRSEDTLARLGGDEFGILLPDCSLDDALQTAQALLDTIQSFRFSWEGMSFRIGASLGLVEVDELTANVTELLKHADTACYVAKEQGRNRVHVYQRDDVEMVSRQGEMQWVTRLNQALEEDRFCLYCQAIEPLDGKHARHHEVLIRMLDADGSVIPSGAFLPSAERYGMISKLDRWVVEQVIILLKDADGDVGPTSSLAVNLSGQSISDETFLDFIMTRLREHPALGTRLIFEITETAAIANLDRAKHFISTLRRFGCRFALDDFGSGLSSFAYLRNLPVDVLKIDGMFVKGALDDPIQLAMVRSINEIAHVMGIETVAEFVENDAVRKAMGEIGVNYVQGFGIDRPRPLGALARRANPDHPPAAR